MLQYTSTVHLDKTQFIQTLDRERKFVDAGIYIENCNVQYNKFNSATSNC